MFKNIHFDPKTNTIEDILKREDVQGLKFEKVVYCNKYEAVAVFVYMPKSVSTQSIGCIRCKDIREYLDQYQSTCCIRCNDIRESLGEYLGQAIDCQEID